MNVLFVCTGNTCRSPMAEALAREEALRLGLMGWEFSSAGISAPQEGRITHEAAQALRHFGIEGVERRRAVQLNKTLVTQHDLVLTMTHAQADYLRRELPEYAACIATLGEYTGLPGDIDDPYAKSQEAYIACAHALKERVYRLFPVG